MFMTASHHRKNIHLEPITRNFRTSFNSSLLEDLTIFAKKIKFEQNRVINRTFETTEPVEPFWSYSIF